MNNEIKMNIYLYKRKLLWIGNIVIRNQKQTFYYDNSPVVNVRPETEVKYVTIGLTKKGVFKRLKRRAYRILGVQNEQNLD